MNSSRFCCALGEREAERQEALAALGCCRVNWHEVLAIITLGLVYITTVKGPLYNVRVQHGGDSPSTYYDHKESHQRFARLVI